MIEVHLLRYALAAADTGSFSQAAEQFRVKQSTLSKRIRFLEQRLGVSLFTRSTQGVAPTTGGLRILARARTIVEDLDLLSSESTALANGNLGTIRIGFHASLASGDLRAILDEYRREFPNVRVDAVEGGRETLVEGLDRGHLDLVVVAGDASSTSRRSLSLWSEGLTIGMPAGHHLSQRDKLYWTDLCGMAFTVTSADPGGLIAAIIASRMTGPSHHPSVLSQAVSRENLPSFATNDCLAVTAGATYESGAIIFREVHDAFGPTRLDQSMVWLGENDNAALAQFLALVGRRYGRSLPLGPKQAGRPPREGERDDLPPQRGGSGGADRPLRN